MKSSLTIGSRGSRLALWQAEWVKTALQTLHPQLQLHIEIIKTSGDVMKDVSLSVIGGKGVFTKELEDALLKGRIDLAVHSLKDLPTILPENLYLAAITEREDPRDALVMRADSETNPPSLAALAAGAVVGTSSPRRLAQLKYLRSDLLIKDLRGNVDTRLRKLDDGEYDAVVLASAGLRRLGLAERISASLDPVEMLPAVGQGALGIETRVGDVGTIELLAQIDHAPTRAACTAERSLLRELGGGCQLPIAGYATTAGDHLRLGGMVAASDGSVLIRETIEGPSGEAQQLGSRLAGRLLALGAGSLIGGLTAKI